MTNDEGSRGAQVLSTVVAFTAIALAIVCLRIFTRTMIVRSIGPEDWLIMLSMLLSIALTVLIGQEVKYGTGRHFDSLAPGTASKALKPLFASIPIYNVSLTMTKCSLLLQYIRIFALQTARRLCWVALAIVVAYSIAGNLTSVFMCTPVSYFWDRSIKGGHCLSGLAIYFSNAAFNIISDLVILIIPIPVLKSLHLPKRQKIGLIGIFGVGAFACVTSILRLHSLYVYSISTDTTWSNAPVATWSSVETNVGIICACLPTMKPLFARFVPRLFGSSLYSRSKPGPTSGAKITAGTSTTTFTRNRRTGPPHRPGDDPFDLALRSIGGHDHRIDVEYAYGAKRADDDDSSISTNSPGGRGSGTREQGDDVKNGHIKVVQVFQLEHEHVAGGDRRSRVSNIGWEEEEEEEEVEEERQAATRSI